MCPTSPIPHDQIRRPVVAGQFYTDNPEALCKEIDEYLQKAAHEPLPGEILAVIAPHAGYMYSGQVAAYAYRQVRGKPFEDVVVVAPSHRTAFAGASVYHQGGYQTPLGLVPVNVALASDLMARSDRLNYYAQAHALEHSLEVQIPFLQRALGQFRLLPIIMGDQDMPTCQMLASALAAVLKGKSALMVASSDLSHYHSYDQAVELDRTILDSVNAFDPEGLHRILWTREAEACGGGPMVTVIMAARQLGATQGRVLHYANSGDVTGDRRQVVGYMAAAIFREFAARKNTSRDP